MSRKTSRNATKNARKRGAQSGAAGAPRSRMVLSGLALSSLALAVSGRLHAQNASDRGTNDANAPRANSKAKDQARKRPGNPATLHLAATTALPANGAGLVAQAATPAASQSVPAPTTGAETLQEIVVTGIRGSLERALQIKKMSLGVVDAISAEDIGQFPDSSIGEAIERIPGVSVSRGNSMSEGNSTIGNVTGVTVRGFGPQFSETLIDGRPIAGGGTGTGTTGIGTGSRSIDFSSIGANFVGEIDIDKTPDFSLSSGDIGATINIKYPKPFDHPGMQASGFASETDSPLDGGVRPAFGALWSDTFAGGTFGILLDGDYTEHNVTAHHVSVAGWVGTHFNSCQMSGGPPCTYDAKGNLTTPTNAYPSWFEQEYQIFQERTDERRKDGRAVLQWHPVDSVMVTLNDDYADDRIITQSGGFSNWFNGGAFSNITQDPNGTVTNFTIGPAPTDLDGAIDASYIKTNSYGLNVIWDMSDDWSAEADASQSVSWQNPGGQLSGEGQDVGYGPSGPGGNDGTCTINGATTTAGCNGYTGGIVDTGPGNLLYPSGFGPNNSGTVNDPGVMGSHVDVIAINEAEDTVNQAKLDATWRHDSTKVNFGAQFVGDTRTSESWTTFINGNNQWELFAGYGPASHNSGGLALPASLFTGTFSTANFIPGYGNNGKLPSNIPWYSPYPVTAYEESLGVGAANANYGPTNGYTYDGTVTPAFAPGSPTAIQEKTYAPFVTAEHNFDLGGMTLKANVGLRYDRTNVTTGGIAQLPTALTVEASDHTAFIDTLTPAEFVQDSNSYHYLLPSLDLNLMVLPDLKVRFDASRTETKPPLNLIVPTLNLTGLRVGALAAAGNNPALLPYLSDNFDLGAEWYYASNDYLSVDAFFKHVSQFPVSETVEQGINGVIDPTTGKLAQWADTTYINGPAADVRGVELGWQQMLKWGFGFQLNGTLVATNSPYNAYDITQEFALPGISNEANFIGFYQRHGFQARVAVNWTGKELLFFGQDNAGGTFGTEPTFLNPTTEVDFSSSYDIDSHVSVFFEALNLTNALYSTHGRFDNQMLDVVEYGQTLTLGVRAKL
jgi:iron complex outermembrane recepter protein